MSWRRRAWLLGAVGVLGLLLARPTRGADEVGPLVARIKAVGAEGAGNPEAAAAWKQLVRRGPDVLPDLLAALDDAGPVAANWLRAAVDAVAERQLAQGRSLPAAALEKFVRDTRHSGPARRLAYEWLARVDAEAPKRLLPGMLHDPGAELRRDAVGLVLADARRRLERGDRPGAAAAYRKALAGALDPEQVDEIAAKLRELGTEVDLAAHFGFLRDWRLLGPFDNHGGAGFTAAFPPEKKVDLAGRCKGKGGVELRWARYTTADPYGVVDLNKALGKHSGAAAYAYAVVVSPAERPVQVRVGSENAVKVFLNGRPIFSREEYHHGMRIDQHVAPATLRAGRNEILLKVCQNEQKEEWAQKWSFQLRLTDAAGAKVPLEAAKGGRP
jgi:hypothetical protein